MNYPVYPFRVVLKELRRNAGLTILAAAEATSYGNYERWESGATRVSAQHLDVIAAAFAVTDDLHLYLYAWLVDRLSPIPGESPLRLDLDSLRRPTRDLPTTTIDLREHKALVVEPGRHLDMALLCLGARYTDRGTVTLPAVERAELPEQSRKEEPILRALYGDVLLDASELVGEALLARGLDDRATGIDVTNIGPALASPDTFTELAEVLDTTDPADRDPLVVFATSTAGDSRRFAELLERLRPQLRSLLEAASDEPVSDEAVERLAEQLLAGKQWPLIKVMMRAARRGTLPAPDAALTNELKGTVARLRKDWRTAAEQQAAVAVRDADPTAIFDALKTLHPRESQLSNHRSMRTARDRQ